MAKFAAMPVSTVGVRYFLRGADTHYGTLQTVSTLIKLGGLWSKIHPNAPIAIGHISRANGQVFPPHKSHTLGVDVDIRPFRNDLKNLPIDIHSVRLYNQDLTIEFLRFLHANANVKLIFFNDPIAVKEKLSIPLAGHSNHMHVRFL